MSSLADERLAAFFSTPGFKGCSCETCSRYARRGNLYAQPFGGLLICLDCYLLFLAIENEVCAGPLPDAGHTADTLAFEAEGLVFERPAPPLSREEVPF